MKNFSEEEEGIIKKFLFTNPGGKDGFIYPQQLVATEEISPLMSAVSRTHLPTQTRILKFVDSQKEEEARGMMPYLRKLMNITREPDGTLKVSRRTRDFTREWVLAHGHSSVKEGTLLVGHSEDISDITVKKVTGHPLEHPQVKSTRYISYGKVLDMSLEDEDLNALTNSEEVIAHVRYMNGKYLETTEKLREGVFGRREIKEIQEYMKRPEIIGAGVEDWIETQKRKDPEFNPTQNDIEKQRERLQKNTEDEQVKKRIGKFVLDYSRLYLLPVTRTSVVHAQDARTLEDVLVDLISSPRIEDQKRGKNLWEEAKKLAPVLLGEKSHVKVDNWRVQNETELRIYLENKFSGLELDNSKEVRLVTGFPTNNPEENDRYNAALVAYQYTGTNLGTLFENITAKDAKEILARAHEARGEYDIIHPAIAHSGMTFDILMPYHGYRDMFRHRRGSRTNQLLSTRNGYETPELFKAIGIDSQYHADMLENQRIFESVREQSPQTAEKVASFGHNNRSLHTWQVNQVGYVGGLRSKIRTGNVTYVQLTRKLGDEVQTLMPETAKYLKIGREEYPLTLWKEGYAWYDETKR